MTDPVPPQPAPVRAASRRKKINRAELVARLWRSAERQVEDIETRLARIGQLPAERDDNSRALGVLVKTLRELAAYDAAEAERRPRAKKRSKHDDDDPVPRDIDEFRRELARRMQAFVQTRTGG